jgi:type 1 fimbria pilin
VNPTNLVLVATAAPAALNITTITVSGGIATITFSGNSSDTAASFELWGSQTITGPFQKMTAAEITALGSGTFRATVPVFSGASGFYRVRRL